MLQKIFLRAIGSLGIVLSIGGGANYAQAQAIGSLPDTVNVQQRDAIRALGTVKRITIDRAGIPNHIEADMGVVRRPTTTVESDAHLVIERLRKVLRADGTETVSVRKTTHETVSGKRFYRLQQRISGIPVIGGEVILEVEDRTDAVTAINLQFLPGVGLPRVPKVGANSAFRTATAKLKTTKVEKLSEPSLAFLRTALGKGYLVWTTRVRYTDTDGRLHVDELMIDAATGQLIETHPQIYNVFSASVGDFQPNVNFGGNDVQTTYDFSLITYNYFATMFPDSWDNGGDLGYYPMISTIHAGGSDTNTAYYIAGNRSLEYDLLDGGYLVFGAGDGVRFAPLNRALDIFAHEFTHGITDMSARLFYSGESGALNESMSDIFGVAVKASQHGVSSSTWRLAEEVVTPAIPGDARRYMNNPTADGVSYDYYPEVGANTDVHYTSGIGNLAFYLLTSGGSHPRAKTSVVVAGIGINDAARIFYYALTNRMSSGSNYSDARNKTAQTATALFGSGSFQFQQVCSAWNAVGVPNDGSVCPSSSAPETPNPSGPVPSAPVIWAISGNALSGAPVNGATSYQLRYDQDGYNSVLQEITGSQISFAASQCDEGWFKVAACNAGGCSGLSNPVYLRGPRCLD